MGEERVSTVTSRSPAPISSMIVAPCTAVAPSETRNVHGPIRRRSPRVRLRSCRPGSRSPFKNVPWVESLSVMAQPAVCGRSCA